MVLVCGRTRAARYPRPCSVPPEIGSSALRDLREPSVVDLVRCRGAAIPFGHQGTAAIVQESRIGRPRPPAQDGVSLVARAADRVSPDRGAQSSRDQVEMARDELRLEQLQQLANPSAGRPGRTARPARVLSGTGASSSSERREVFVDDLRTVVDFVRHAANPCSNAANPVALSPITSSWMVSVPS